MNGVLISGRSVLVSSDTEDRMQGAILSLSRCGSTANTMTAKREMPWRSSRPRPCTCKAAVQERVLDSRREGSAYGRSLYEVLGVKKNASSMEIKTAYRTMAKMYHPDASSFSNSSDFFIQIHNAYATLSDPVARAIYDLSLGDRSFVSYTNSMPMRSRKSWESDQCW